MKIKIRATIAADLPQVKNVLDLAFQQTDEGLLVEKIWDSDAFIPELSLIATDETETIVGYILFSKIEIIGIDQIAESIALAPVAVVPERQQKNIGGRLIQEGLAIAKHIGFLSVIVLGHENYYPKFDFAPASKWQITCPFPVPDKNFMTLELIPNALRSTPGVVKYSQAFME